MSRPSWDELKMQRDGHLDPTRIPAKDHQWLEPIYRQVERLPNGNVLCEIVGGGGHVEFGPP